MLFVHAERDVRKVGRDLTTDLSSMEKFPLKKVETVTKRYLDLYADMKRLERENAKSKRRADQLQKDKDHSRSEISKASSAKDKMEKLSRELSRENKKIKVRRANKLVQAVNWCLLIVCVACRKTKNVLNSANVKAATHLAHLLAEFSSTCRN